MDEHEDVESKAREAVQAARKVYTSAEWLGWAEAWLSKNDRTGQAAVRAAFLIPGMDKHFTIFGKAIQASLDLHAHGEDETSEAFEERSAEIIGLAERILPQSVDAEAARPRAAAESAFWATLSASFAGIGAVNAARTCAETSLRLSELLDEG